MHSSGMHTAHLLTVSQHALHRGNVCPGGLPGGLHRGVFAQGVSAWGVCWGGGGCVCPGGLPGGAYPGGFCPGGVCPGRCLSGGFCPGGLPGRLSAWEVSARGGVAWEVVCPGGVSARGGMPGRLSARGVCPGGQGCLSRGCVSQYAPRPNTHPVDRQTLRLKTVNIIHSAKNVFVAIK